MDITTILAAIAPQFDADPLRNTHIELAKIRTSLTAWSANKYPYAVALRAAHTLTLAKNEADGISGEITSKSEGDQSISFSVGQGNNEYLSQTSYGKDLLSLIHASILPLDLVNRYKLNISLV